MPNHQLMTAGKYPQGLIGCLWDLKIDDSGTINLYDAAKSGANVDDCEEWVIYVYWNYSEILYL